ncbi:MAG: helix-turn-helix transcriptional regulator [Pseudomonadales bacterium]
MSKPSVSEIDKLIGQRLKMLRQQHKVSAAALAEVMDTSQQQVSRYERGLNRLSGLLLWQLAGYFAVPMSWFFLDVVDESSTSPFANEKLSSYEVSVSKEQLAILSRCWPALGKVQREAVIKMTDVFLQVT